MTKEQNPRVHDHVPMPAELHAEFQQGNRRPPPWNTLVNAAEELGWDLDDELTVKADHKSNTIIITNETNG